VYRPRVFFRRVFSIAAFSLMWPVLTATADPESAPKAVKSRDAFANGDFEQAIDELSEALRSAETAADNQRKAGLLARRAEAYQALGLYEPALQDLRSALSLSDHDGQIAKLMGSTGQTLFLAGHPEKAKGYLEASIAKARDNRDANVLAASLNNLGNVAAAQDKVTEAVAAYVESASAARKGGNTLILAKAMTNQARTLIATQQPAAADIQTAQSLLTDALAELDKAPHSHEKVYALIGASESLARVNSIRPAKDAQEKALDAMSTAIGIAGELKDHRASSYALGHLGNLYEEQQRYPEALELTQRALFFAQQVSAPEILYLWQWQRGRLLRAQGDINGAIAAYRQAVYHLQSVRSELSTSFAGSRSLFRERVGPVYFELADLLLKRGANLHGAETVQRDLLEARGTVELLKAAELRDYFQDECVTALQSRITGVDRVAAGTAALYPILLTDRTELLLSLPGRIEQYTVPASSQTLIAEVRKFRKKLEKRTTREYLPHSQKLYDWLIRPLEIDLEREEIKTIVFVPDGALRTIPMSALHDGDRFLIAKYAVATTPGLTLTDLRPLKRDKVESLVTGLTEPVQGFPALPNVEVEIKNVHDLYGGKVLQDDDFVVPALERELASTPYSIVHIASHGKFESDSRKSFLLAFDQKLGMDRLEQLMQFSQYRRDPVELLTLSACQTAAGDDRAALGLAGVAIKAGARSALASLWYINDEASSILISDFYRALHQPSNSKARALQEAQLKLLRHPQWAHPAYWAPFLLIGSWL
jgi:CHAT domain-containing protein